MIDHGQIIADDTAARLKANLAGDLLAVEVAADSAERVRGLLGRAAAGGEINENVYDGVVRFRLRLTEGARLAPALLKEMHDAGAPGQSLELKSPTLDDVFLELTGRTLREGASRVVMIALFGTSMTGSNLQYELMTGSYERILATPLSRSSLMIGRALKEWAPLVVQGLLIALICIPFGFIFYPLHVLFGLVILGIFGIGLGALSYALALVSQNKEWIFWGVQQTLLFPLMILSGIMLPIEAGPDWMKTASLFNPLTYLVNAERELFAGGVGTDTLLGLLAASVTAAVGLVVGVRTINRNIS